MIKTKASKWFHFKVSPWNIMLAIRANTIRLMHSCTTLSCTKENGPPLPWKPMRLAGTWQQYSKKAMPHEKAMTPINGQWLDTPVC